MLGDFPSILHSESGCGSALIDDRCILNQARWIKEQAKPTSGHLVFFSWMAHLVFVIPLMPLPLRTDSGVSTGGLMGDPCC